MATPPDDQLPSARALVRSTLIALAVAMALLVAVILPAEFGVDPTGVGRPLGLTRMGEIKMALARDAAVATAQETAVAEALAALPDSDSLGRVDRAEPAAAALNTHVTEVTLAPGEGKEIKLVMKKGSRVTFSWSVGGGVVNYDTHGDPFDAPRGFYHGYEKGTATPSQEGVLEAAFDGLHGWFWRNRGSQPVTLTLRTEGAYEELRKLY